MHTKEAINSRRSTRVFNDKPISANLIEELIDYARLAPTARNEQPWEFVAVTKKEALEKIANITEHGKFINKSACCIAVFCKETKYYLEDGCAATENILIGASSLGISSCWVAGDKKPYGDNIRELLNVPQGYKLVSLLALGYSDAPFSRIPKRPLKEVLHWEKF